MIHLTELVFFFRRSRKKVALSIAAFILLIVFLNSWETIKRILIPVKPPPETIAFGQIPPYDISDGVKPAAGVEYRLQTITGNLPNLQKNAKVFQVAKKTPSFATEESIKEKAKLLNLKGEPEKITGSVMEFTSATKDVKNLIFDTLTGHLVFSYKLEPSLIEEKPRNVDNDKRVAALFFEMMGLDFSQYPQEKTTTKNLKFENGKIVEADSLSNADMIEVDFFFTDIQDLPTLFIKKGVSPVFALVTNGRVIYAKKESLNVELYKFATYPLKPVSKAWAELVAGGGYYNSENSNSTIDIKEVKLGYVMGYNNNEFIQPVYIFKGEGDFAAFIPAVDDKWIEKESS